MLGSDFDDEFGDIAVSVEEYDDVMSDTISNATSPHIYSSSLRRPSQRHIIVPPGMGTTDADKETTQSSVGIGVGPETPWDRANDSDEDHVDDDDGVAHHNDKFRLLIGLLAPDVPLSFSRTYANKINLDPDTPGQFVLFRDKTAKLVPWIRKAFYASHPRTASQTLRGEFLL